MILNTIKKSSDLKRCDKGLSFADTEQIAKEYSELLMLISDLYDYVKPHVEGYGVRKRAHEMYHVVCDAEAVLRKERME